MKTIKICTPVIGNNLNEFLSNLEKIQQISNCIELRIDYIQNLSQKDIVTIKKNTTSEVVFTCRNINEGGKFVGHETERLKIIQQAIDLKFDYIDIEFETMKQHQFVYYNHPKIILSYHNFQETPEYWQMNKLIFEMKKFEPFILKIATQVNEEYDNVKLYRLMVNKKTDDHRVIIGMGEKGKATRILGPILGNYLTFASTEYSQSAAGQVNIKKLRELYNKLSFMS